MRSVSAPAAALGLLLLAQSAHAQPSDAEPLRLTWRAPAECPSAEAIRTATLHGAPGLQSTGAVLEADARVEERVGSGASIWRVVLRTRRGGVIGEREIEGPTCAGVADATAVLLALALVPPGAAPAPDAASTSAAETSTPKPPRSAREEHHALAFGAAIAGDASSLPAPAIGGSVTLAWTPGRFRLEAEARRWASQSRSVDGSEAGARFSMTSVGGRACWPIVRAAALDASPCAGADVSFVSAPGYGADANFSASGSWTAVAGGLLGRVTLASWLAARARVDAFVPLSRPTFVVENEGDVHRPPTLGVSASLGVEVLFL